MPIINVVGGTNFLGYYTSLVELQTAYPTGEPGDWAIVDGDPAAVYAWSEVPTPGWENSGTAGSITSVFGRPGPNIVAVAGDYSADLIGDANVYGQAALTYGTTVGIDPATAYVSDALAELASDAHNHPNLVNIDTINQNLRTNSAVTFKTLNLTDSLPFGTTRTYMTMTDTFQGETVEFQLETDPDGLSSQTSGLHIKASKKISLYTDGANLAALIDASQALFSGDVYAGYNPANGVTNKFVVQAKTTGGSDVSAEFQLFPDSNELFLLTSGPGVDPRFRFDGQTVLGGAVAAGNYKLYVGNTNTEVARFDSSNASGALIDISFNNSTTVLEAGSRLAIAATGTKSQGMIQAADDLWINAIGGQVYVQDGALTVDTTGAAKVGVNRTIPIYTLDVNGVIASKFTGDGELQMQGGGGGQASISMNTYGASSGLYTWRINGTGGAPTAVLNNDILYEENHRSYGTGLLQSVIVEYSAVGNHSASNAAADVAWKLAQSGSTTLTEVFNIAGSGITVTQPTTALSRQVTIRNISGTNGETAGIDFHDTGGLGFSMSYQRIDANNGHFELYEERIVPGAPIWRAYMADKAFELWGALKTDTITEHTTNAGVTIEGVLHLDENVYGGTLVGDSLTVQGTTFLDALNTKSFVFLGQNEWQLGTTTDEYESYITGGDGSGIYLTAQSFTGAGGGSLYLQPSQNSMVWGFGASKIEMLMDATGFNIELDNNPNNKSAFFLTTAGAIFNNGNKDLNFTVRKNASGNAMIYDAGDDTWNLDAASTTIANGGNSVIEAVAGAVNINTGQQDIDFRIYKNGSPVTAMFYNSGTDFFNINAASSDFTAQTVMQLRATTFQFFDYPTANVGLQMNSSITTFNQAAIDRDFEINKLTSGKVMLYDAGADALTLDADTATVNAATLLELNALLTDVKQTLRISQLNSGDEILTTDANGNVQESGIKATTAPAGGSGFTVVEYAVAPVNPPAGFMWMQAKDANTKTWSYYDGVKTYSVDLSV